MRGETQRGASRDARPDQQPLLDGICEGGIDFTRVASLLCRYSEPIHELGGPSGTVGRKYNIPDIWLHRPDGTAKP